MPPPSPTACLGNAASAPSNGHDACRRMRLWRIRRKELEDQLVSQVTDLMQQLAAESDRREELERKEEALVAAVAQQQALPAMTQQPLGCAWSSDQHAATLAANMLVLKRMCSFAPMLVCESVAPT